MNLFKIDLCRRASAIQERECPPPLTVRKQLLSITSYYQPKMAGAIQGKDVYSDWLSYPCNFRQIICVHLRVYNMSD